MSAQDAFDRRAKLLGIAPTKDPGGKSTVTALTDELHRLMDEVEAAQKERDQAKKDCLQAERALAKVAHEHANKEKEPNPLAQILETEQAARNRADTARIAAEQRAGEAERARAVAETRFEAEKVARITAEEALEVERNARQALEAKPPTVVKELVKEVLQAPQIQAKQVTEWDVKVTGRDAADRVRSLKIKAS